MVVQVMRSARWIDLGTCAPAAFHATYAGLAETQTVASEPVVLWAQPRAHISIGQSQDRAAEIVAEPGVPVIRRALGGGAVWVDEAQDCVVLIVPVHLVPQRWSADMTWALSPAVETMRMFGLPAELRERDIWVRGRKIAGSGAATIGVCAVIAFSFLRCFPKQQFARCVALPRDDLRGWLDDALAVTMTDWAQEGVRPSTRELASAFRKQVKNHLGWISRDSMLDTEELHAIDEIRADSDDGQWTGRSGRMFAGGIRLNASSFLLSVEQGDAWRDTLIVDGHIVRTSVHGRAYA
jgi:lipoate---protein ligase